MYVTPNLPSKAAVNRAIKNGTTVRLITVSPFESVPVNGTAVVEGPHFPQPHRWYGTATVVDGVVTRVK